MKRTEEKITAGGNYEVLNVSMTGARLLDYSQKTCRWKHRTFTVPVMGFLKFAQHSLNICVLAWEKPSYAEIVIFSIIYSPENLSFTERH